MNDQEIEESLRDYQALLQLYSAEEEEEEVDGNLELAESGDYGHGDGSSPKGLVEGG